MKTNHRQPLFDRFTDTEHKEVFLNEKQLIESIQQELFSLLNTRCIFPKSRRRTKIPLNYGIPHLFGMQEEIDMLNPTIQNKWARRMTQVIAYFEPRLIKPRLTIKKLCLQQQRLDIHIQGYIRLNDGLRLKSFNMGLLSPY